MAQKRMFTMQIVDSDAFLDMPLSTQCLYFHLNMRADDDGFIGNPKRIQKNIGASEDDLKLLIAKRFILVFEDGVIVIKHWRMHNCIQRDRYTPTAYQDELKTLKIKENKAYSIDVNNSYTECIQNVSTGLDIDIDIDLDKGLDKDTEKKKKKQLANAQTYFSNDEILNQTFIEFMKMRSTLKNGKMTERAISMMINKINKYDSETAIAMLNQSIINNWKDIYEVKAKQSNSYTKADGSIDWSRV